MSLESARNSPRRDTLAQLAKLTPRQWIALAICLLVLVGKEYRDQTHVGENPCTLREHPAPDWSPDIYRWAVGRLQPHPQSNYVTLITLSDQVEPAIVMNNVCEQRWYLSRLVRQLSAQGASVIVIDKFFGAKSCRDDDPSTTALIQSVQTASSHVVVGASTQPSNKDPEVCLALDETKILNFELKASSHDAAAYTGLTRLNSDVRKIPLNWYADKKTNVSSPEAILADNRHNTLAYTAAALFPYVDLSHNRSLQSLRRNSIQPFTSFIRLEDMSKQSALSVLCLDPDWHRMESHYNDSVCSITVPKGYDHRVDVNRRVVVIGEDSKTRDRHKLFDEDVSGVYLQANYIESLLANHYMKPVGQGWDLAIFFLWLAFVQAIFWAEPLEPLKSLLYALGVGAALVLAIGLLAYFCRYYVDLGVQGIGVLYLLLRFADSYAAATMRKKPVHKMRSPAQGAGKNPM